jgi:hypothetical protein
MAILFFFVSIAQLWNYFLTYSHAFRPRLWS